MRLTKFVAHWCGMGSYHLTSTCHKSANVVDGHSRLNGLSTLIPHRFSGVRIKTAGRLYSLHCQILEVVSDKPALSGRTSWRTVFCSRLWSDGIASSCSQLLTIRCQLGTLLLNPQVPTMHLCENKQGILWCTIYSPEALVHQINNQLNTNFITFCFMFIKTNNWSHFEKKNFFLFKLPGMIIYTENHKICVIDRDKKKTSAGSAKGDDKVNLKINTS